MKKLKLLFSISTFCFALAVLCFGVFSAISATYTLGGSVTYVVQDVYVTIRTRVYYSKTKASSESDISEKTNQLLNSEVVASSVSSGDLVPVAKYNNGILDVNTFTDNRDPAEYPTMSEDTKIAIEYGKESMSYFIVIEITNIGDNEIWAGTTTYDITENCNTLRAQTAFIDSIAKDETKTIVYGFSLDDEKTSIQDGVTFDYQITISSDMENKGDIDTSPRIESVGKNFVPTQQQLSNTPISTNLDVKPNTDATYYGSIFNFTVPSGVSSFTFAFQPFVSIGEESISLFGGSFGSTEWLKEIKLFNKNVTDFATIYGTEEYNNAQELSNYSVVIIDDNNGYCSCTVSGVSGSEISVVVTYSDDFTFLQQEASYAGIDLSRLSCNVNLIGDLTPDVKLTIMEEQTLSQKVYLKDSVGNFGFNKSGDYYYQNFYVKNYFNKYDKLYLYLSNTVGTAYVLSGERDSIELTDIIATLNSNNNVVELTKDNAQSFCIVSTAKQGSLKLMPDKTKKMFDYEVLENNTIALTKYWSDGASRLEIPSIIDGHTVTKIYTNTINNDTIITDLIVPDTVTHIEQGSLICTKLENVTMPTMNTLDCNDDRSGEMFSNCAFGTPEKIIPETIKTIKTTKDGTIRFGGYDKMTNLTTIEFGDNVTSVLISIIGCTKLTTISLGSNVNEIELERVSGYSYSYDSYPFMKNNTSNGLTIFTARDGQTKYLLKADSSITSITKEMINGVRVFSGGSLSACANLETLEIPSSLVSMGGQVFSTSCPWYSNLTANENGLKIVNAVDDVHVKYLMGSTSSIPEIITTEMLNGVRVIYNSAFINKSQLKSISIPSSVNSIGDSAFSNCTNLRSVYITDLEKWCNIRFGALTANPLYNFADLYLNDEKVTNLNIPNSITKVGNYAFSGLDCLTNVQVPSSVMSIGNRAFYNCYNLSNVTIEEGVRLIDEYAFSECLSLENITIPSSVVRLGQDVFNNCVSLQNMDIPEGVKIIYDAAFYNCSNLKSLVLPSTLRNMGLSNTIVGCDNLEHLSIRSENSILKSVDNCLILKPYKGIILGCKTSVIPDDGSVTGIGGYAFWKCKNLTSINIPSSVTEIDDGAFYGCDKLSKVHITDLSKWCNISFGSYSANPLYNGANLYLNGTLVTDLVIPSSVTSIGNYAFNGCSNFTSITFEHGSSVTSIGSSAFNGCSNLTSITIPSSVTSIGRGAFYGCSNLTSVTFEDPNGWKANNKALTLTNTSTNATYLKSTYYNYTWTKSA